MADPRGSTGQARGHVPLAVRNAFHDRGRLVRSLAGIAFAVFLMLVQFGFQAGFVDSALGLIRGMDADIVLTSPAKYQASNRAPFSRRALAQALAVPGVASARPILGEWKVSFWKNPATGALRTIQVIGIDPDQPVLLFPEVNAHRAELRRLGTVLFDRRSRSDFGAPEIGQRTELAHRAVEVVGTFSLGPDFVVDGTVVTSDRTFEMLFPSPGNQRDGATVAARPDIEFGLVKVAEGYDIAAVRDALRAALAPGATALTRDELVAQEDAFQSHLSGVGPIFDLGVAIGFIVGAMISYQILFTEISDQAPQYATLKAMGYRDKYLTKVVLQQACVYAVVGFVPAWLLASLVLVAIREVILLPLGMSLRITATGLGLTLLMCLLSGLISVRRVYAADPSDVF